jgi:hypothetical protein
MYQLMEVEGGEGMLGRECYCVSVTVQLFSSAKTTISERVHIRSLGKMGKMFLFNPQDINCTMELIAIAFVTVRMPS